MLRLLQLAGQELVIEADHGLVGDQLYPAVQQHWGNLLLCSVEDNVAETAAVAFRSSLVAAAELPASASAACSRWCSAVLWEDGRLTSDLTKADHQNHSENWNCVTRDSPESC